jgi:BolA family transcriptional regulator, general stress-responsive regulator
MSRVERVKKALSSLSPTHLEVIDESHMHGRGGAETHLRVIVVTEQFHAMNRVARQRLVHAALEHELQSGLHALSLLTLTDSEWKAQGQRDQTGSPPCQHGKD